MSTSDWTELAADLFLYRDACNVYLLRSGAAGTAVDFGTGAWVSRLGEIGVRRLDHVVLTHAHRDQLCGLYRGAPPDCPVHAPAGDAALLQEAELERLWAQYQAGGCPPCYSAPCQPIRAQLDMAPDTETRVGAARFCSVATPGHTRGALSYVVEWRRRHLAFCGDAVHAGGALWEPYHLEWDHWTPAGCLEAWYGLERLGGCGFDLLLPAHGPVVAQRPRAAVRQTQQRILDLVHAKGSVCAGEKSRWLDLERLGCGAWRVLPHLYHFGANSFLLASEGGTGLVVDPQIPDVERVVPLMGEVGVDRIEVGTSSHYHLDHSDGLGWLARQLGAQVWLHPWVAEPLADRDRYDLPWLPASCVPVDRLLPEEGPFTWREYELSARPFPGQTRWHAAIDTRVDGRHVLFSGDNYQPPTRWNGTGGFCAYNGSRFGEPGYRTSARTALDVAPQIICNGHGCIYRFAPCHYRRILRWAVRAEGAVAALCPSEAWLADYDCHAARWQPFVSRLARGQRATLSLLWRNHRPETVEVIVRPLAPQGWTAVPEQASLQVEGGAEGSAGFTVEVPADAPAGRHLMAADLETPRGLQAEACVALLDVA
ncbi:MAG: MBL fold metallo-hydrolase [Candidatus Latescibacterota bacterium]